MSVAIMAVLLSSSMLATVGAATTTTTTVETDDSSNNNVVDTADDNSRSLSMLDPSTVEMKESYFVEQAALTELGQEPLFHPSARDDWKKDTFQRLDRVRANCGKLCTFHDKASIDKYIQDSTTEETNKDSQQRHLEVGMSCPAILNCDHMDALDETVRFPPPVELMPFYTMNGLVKFHKKRTHDLSLPGSSLDNPVVWSKSIVDSYMLNCATPRQQVFPPYGTASDAFLDKIQYLFGNSGLRDQRVLVLGGDVNPWVEAVALYLGAPHVTTILPPGLFVDNHHPHMTALTPNEFRLLHGQPEGESTNHPWYDVVLSFSDMDFGLGRRGESLNPWSDLLAVARARCVTRPGGILVMGLASSGDRVVFNEGRSYSVDGRLPLLTANWIPIVSKGDQQQRHNGARGGGGHGAHHRGNKMLEKHSIYAFRNTDTV